MSEALDDILVIGGNGLSLGARSLRAVDVEFDQADGEELHHLSGVVLIGTDVSRPVWSLVAEHAQIHSHGRMQGHLLHEVREVSEGVSHQDIVVVRQPIGHLPQPAKLRHHHDLREGERDALSKLVGPVERIAKPDIEPVAVQLRQAIRFRQGPQIGQLKRCRLPHLSVDPGFHAKIDDGFRILDCCAKGGLVEQSKRLHLGEWRW